MNMRIILTLGMIWLLAALLAGCSGVPAGQAPTEAPAPTLPATAIPMAIVTAVPSATAMPLPTATPLPSATAVPSPTTTPPSTTPTATPAPAQQRFGYPIGWPDRQPADGFFIRHGYAVENTWFNPNYWHAGEDWYAETGDTAGAEVYAVAAGEVMYVGSNYPGRVVIVRHADDLFSMYGHLDPAVDVAVSDRVELGERLGVVLRRGDTVPNHLHFELRTFFTTPEVNGAQPRYPFRCGVNCAPGPGYWPIGAPDHPSDQGWRNPLHVIAGRMFAADAAAPLGTVVVPQEPPVAELPLWSAPANRPDARQVGGLALTPGQPFALLELATGPEDERGTSAEAYTLWYRIALPDGGDAWVQGAIADGFERGGDGRPATVRLTLLVR